MTVRDDHLHAATLTARCDWPMRASRATMNRVWRAAFIAETAANADSGSWHAAWSGRDPKTGETENLLPRVFYRVDLDPRSNAPVPRLTIIDRNQDLVQSLMLFALQRVRQVRLNRAREGDCIMPLSFEVSTEAVWPWLSRGMAVYETVTPYYPTKNATDREPQWRSPLHAAWASSVLHSSLLNRLNGWGFDPLPVKHIPWVQVLEHKPMTVAWERPQQDKRFATGGFQAKFATKLLLPDGLGIGHHSAEGWGSLRLVEQSVTEVTP